MTTIGAVLDSSAWRRFWTLLVLVVVGGLASWLLGLPLPTSARGWLPVVVVVLLAVGAWAWVLPRLLPPLAARLGLLAAVGAVAGWLLLSPLFIDRMVDEQLPGAEAAAAAPAAGATATEGPADPEATEPPADDQPADGQADAEPQRLAVGTFTGIGHQASGMAALYELADGQRLVRLEDVDIQNGPDLFVYLVPQPGQSDDDGAVNLGRLKGNQGSHNYPVPADVDTDDFATVLVWCRAFATPFASATLAAP